MTIRFIHGVLLLAMAAGGAGAADGPSGKGWEHTLNLRLGVADYDGSPQHKNFHAQWVYAKGENPRWGGYTAGFAHFTRDLVNGAADINQADLYGELHRHFPALGGRLTGKLYLHYAEADHRNGHADGVVALEPRVGWLSGDKRFHADLGYAHSDYPNDFEVAQWTPTLGLNLGPVGVRLRHYHIKPSNPARAFGLDETDATELMLSYRFARPGEGTGPLGLSGLHLNLLEGERVYALDSDMLYLMPLTSRQSDSWRVGASFRLNRQLRLAVMAGTNRRHTQRFDFDMDFVGVNLATTW